MSNFAADYVDVAERIRMFRDLYPEGSLRPASLERPFWIEDVPNVGPRLVYVAAAYRHPEDPAPGIGSAWEPLPGKTPYTRDSELMVAETSAWGRAIVAALAADTKRGVASADEVRARRQESGRKTWSDELQDRAIASISNAPDDEALEKIMRHAATYTLGDADVEALNNAVAARRHYLAAS
jgi:hypothetical protein